MAPRKQKDESTAIATKKDAAAAKPRRNRIQELSSFLEGRRSEIVKILPENLSVERVMKTAIMAAMENEEIGQKCTSVSIYRSVVQASLMGLTVGSGFNEGYFIRYGNSCTFRASYLGWTKVALRSDGVDMIRASVVCTGDEFEMSEQPPVLIHKPLRQSSGDVEGAVAVAYTLRELPDGRISHAMLDFAFVDADDLAMAKKMADRHKESPAWKSWPNEMRKKVAVRRLCKWLPRNEQLERLSRIENSADNGIVDVPDPDIPSDMKVIDQRFDDMPQEQEQEQAPAQAPTVELPEPEVMQPEKPASGRKSATSKLKDQMTQGAPSAPQDAPPAAPPPDPGPPPDDGDDPDYGGPAAADMDF